MQITHKAIDGKLVQIVSATSLRKILRQNGDTKERPKDFGPDDEWRVAD